MATIFLTGASGFLGRYVLSNLLNSGNSVRALARSTITPPPVRRGCIELIKGRLSTVTSESLKNCDIFIHLASAGVLQEYANIETCFRTNVYESVSLWRMALSAGVKNFLICGSCFEYGKSGEIFQFIPVDAPLMPVTAYGASKASASLAALAMANEFSANFTIVRPFHLFGKGEHQTRFWPSLVNAALNGYDFPMTMGEQVRDFTPVEYAASKISQISLDLLGLDPDIRLVNIGHGNPQTLLDFAKSQWSLFNASGKLLPGAVPYRQDEIMRYVPLL